MIKEKNNVTLISLSSIGLFLTWIALVIFSAPLYQNLASSDPLAMINVLFPSFWVILIAFVGVCFVAFLQSAVPRWLHMLLLAQLSLMLFYTPFLISGFSWSPDSLWHGGVASYLPEIFSGVTVASSSYAHAYPLSFLVTYLVEQAGLDVFNYSLYVYPFVCTVLFSVLAYFFASRVLNSKTAFLAMLITLPALHYIELHVSPFSAGTLLFFISLIFFTYNGKLAKILGLTSLVLLVTVHPISPVMAAVYFFSCAIVGLFLKSDGSKKFNFSISPVYLFVFTCAIWGVWTLYASSVYPGVKTSVASVLNFNFLSRLLVVSDFATGGAGFIYPTIHYLSLGIYALILFLFFSGRLISVADLKRFFGRMISVLTAKRLSFIFAAVIYAALGFLLYLSSGERFLLGRGLLYFIFFGSLIIVSYFITQPTKWKSVRLMLFLKARLLVVFALIIFLVCTFPVISYSKEAYNTFTPSANAGLQFMSTNTDLSEHSLSMSNSQQLASYVNITNGLTTVRFPPNMSKVNPDIVAMRINGYFQVSMRTDLSFTNNSYTQLSDYLTQSSEYNRVYSNQNFDVYVK